MPREKGCEWVYVKSVQPEGTDGVKQVERCMLCEHRVPGCGMAKCAAAEDKLEPVKKDQQLNRATASVSAAAAPAKN
eukprot:687339-Pelagomonas_calceolata.AAC.1